MKVTGRTCQKFNLAALTRQNHKPFVSFELNREISDAYITMIRPEIRDGAFTVTVCTNRMLDNLGMSSKKWEAVDGMDDLIEANEEQTINDICKHAVELAIADHRILIEQVGVPQSAAKIAAKKAW